MRVAVYTFYGKNIVMSYPDETAEEAANAVSAEMHPDKVLYGKGTDGHWHIIPMHNVARLEYIDD